MPFFDDNQTTARFKRGALLPFLTIIATACFLCPAHAEEKPNNPPLPRYNSPSTNMSGMLGLNTIPNARMDKTGTIRMGASISDPYIHSYLGFQIAKPLYINLRRTAEANSLTSKPNRIFSAIDFKLRLAKETKTRPEISLGIDSAFGHKRISREYIALSKRFNNFDVTTGMVWGDLGGAGHIKNPLRTISSHFDKRYDDSPERPRSIANWFTGEDIGFFGGIEYFTPIKGLSLKADYNAKEYQGEKNNIKGFTPPSPWSAAINYKPREWINLSGGIIGGEKIMARLSLQNNISNWPGKESSLFEAPELIAPRSQDNKDGENAAALSLSKNRPTGQQIGHAARIIANRSPEESESISITLKHKGLKGRTLTLIRKDLEKAIINKQGSPEEIWQDTIISEPEKDKFSFKNFFKNNSKHSQSLHFVLDNNISLTGGDIGVLYRNSALIEGEKSLPFGIITGGGVRLNLKDNLSRISLLSTINRFLGINSVRDDEPAFAKQRVSIDRLYTSWLKSLNSDTHIALTGGYLEEMFAGYGGEILYRPFGKTFSIGAEGWKIFKRNPYSALNKEFNKKGALTGHLNLFYEVPNQDITAYAKIGQYLDQDIGATFGLKTRFKNGATLDGFMTGTSKSDTDIFGNNAHIYGGIKLNLPIGNIPFLSSGSQMRMAFRPFARDSGQILNHPIPLFDVTEPFSYRRLSRSWEEILD